MMVMPLGRSYHWPKPLTLWIEGYDADDTAQRGQAEVIRASIGKDGAGDTVYKDKAKVVKAPESDEVPIRLIQYEKTRETATPMKNRTTIQLGLKQSDGSLGPRGHSRAYKI